MKIFPAIDIKDKKCVRLIKGDFDNKTEYETSPIDQAKKYKDNGLIVLGVPSNQFGGQEPGTNSEIKKFCEVNFNVNFPLTHKVDVKGSNAHSIFLWAKNNYGNSAIPKWNFHKILINKDGKIQQTYSSFTKPMSKKIISEIEKILNKE